MKGSTRSLHESPDPQQVLNERPLLSLLFLLLFLIVMFSKICSTKRPPLSWLSNPRKSLPWCVCCGWRVVCDVRCACEGVMFDVCVVCVLSMECVGCVTYGMCVKRCECSMCGVCSICECGVRYACVHVCPMYVRVSSHHLLCPLPPARHSLHYLGPLDSVPLPGNHCHTYIFLVTEGQAC